MFIVLHYQCCVLIYCSVGRKSLMSVPPIHSHVSIACALITFAQTLYKPVKHIQWGLSTVRARACSYELCTVLAWHDLQACNAQNNCAWSYQVCLQVWNKLQQRMNPFGSWISLSLLSLRSSNELACSIESTVYWWHYCKHSLLI